MEIFLIKVLQFVLAISLLVLLHEGGHFLFSKLFGVRVEKFYLFFDPWFHLFEFKPKHSATRYGIGWLPLGGYCKIAGMIDESFDTEQMKRPAQPWEFRSKPAWQRLLIMVGGVVVNFFLALFIYQMCLLHWGDNYVQMKDMTMGMKFSPDAKALGFQDGDVLLGTDKGEFKGFSADVFRDLATAREAYVVRGGKQQTVALPGDLDLLSMLKSTPTFTRPFTPARVDSVLPGSVAQKMGLRKGDTLKAVNGKAIDSYNEFTYEMGRRADMLAAARTTRDSVAARTVAITFVHAGDSVPKTTAGLASAELTFGFVVKTSDAYYPVHHVSYGFFESIPAGARYGWNVLSGYVGDMRYLFSADGAKSLGGFGTLGGLFPPVWDWHLFWLMTAFLSIILAFMNILPIPALDGGHVLFLLYEIVTRRQPGEKFLLYAEYVGFSLLLLLMVVANLNDILRWIGVM